LAALQQFNAKALSRDDANRQSERWALCVTATPSLCVHFSWELIQAGLKIKRQLDVPIHYKGQILATPLRLDLLVSDLVIIECKATSKYNEVFEAQVLTYLRLMNLKLGIVINFGERFAKDGFHRVVGGL